MITKENSPLAWELRQRRAQLETHTTPGELQEILRKFEENGRVKEERRLKIDGLVKSKKSHPVKKWPLGIAKG